MPSLRQSQQEKIEQTLALCHPQAGDIEKFDTAVTKLDAAEREVALRQAGRQLRQVGQQRVRLQEVAGALERLQDASAYRAIVLSVETANGESIGSARVQLALLGQPTRLVAGTLPGVEPAELRCGDEVEVVQSGPQHFAVRCRIGVHVRHGAVAPLEEILAPDVLRVRRGPDVIILRAVGSAAQAIDRLGGDPRALIGRLVSYDEQLGLAFTLFGDPERNQLVSREFPNVHRSDLVLAPGTLRMLEDRIILPLRHPELAGAHGVGAGQFFIFDGPLGVGKTRAAQWIASELDLPVYLVSGGEIADMWYGGSEAKLRTRISAARSEPNGAVLVWDEAESMLIERGRSLVGVEDRIVALLLSETDGFARRGNVLYILTTNRADRIDSGLKRSLRAVTVPFERPDAPRTRALFRLYLGGVACADSGPEEMARTATLAIFAEREAIAEAILRNGARLPLSRAMAVSGAMVRASCEGARRRAFVRQARGNGSAGPTGVLLEDLLMALDDELGAVARNLTVANVGHVLGLPPGVGEQIVALEPNPGGACGAFN